LRLARFGVNGADAGQGGQTATPVVEAGAGYFPESSWNSAACPESSHSTIQRPLDVRAWALETVSPLWCGPMGRVMCSFVHYLLNDGVTIKKAQLAQLKKQLMR
jgi:hypothetical protein